MLLSINPICSSRAMLSLVTICKVYVNKLGVLQFFIEQDNKQVFQYSYWLIQNELKYLLYNKMKCGHAMHGYSKTY